MKTVAKLIITTLLALPVTVIADSDLDLIDSLSIEEMMDLSISSSTGTDKPLSLAPAIATVITDKQIAQSTAQTLDEILEQVPGLHVYPSATSAYSGNFDIRGIHTKYNSQIMLLMNGSALKGLKFGNLTSGLNVPLSAVKRIEIVRGPGSVIYGANAFSGVINIITKDAEYLANNSELGIRYGSFNSAESWMNYGKKSADYAYAVTLSAMLSDGDNERIMQADAQTVNDALFGSSASNAPGSLNTAFERYSLNVNLVKGDLELNLYANALNNGETSAGIANALDPNGSINHLRIQSDFYYHQKLDSDIKLEHKFSLSHQEQETLLYVFPAGAILPIGSDGNFFGTPPRNLVTFTDGYIGKPSDIENTAGYEATLILEQYADHLVRLSMGYNYGELTASDSTNFGPGAIDGTVSPVDGSLTDNTGTPAIYLLDAERSIYFLSVQDEWRFSADWNLTAGVRYDHYSDFGSTINPRLALVWQTTPILTTKLLYGRAFRAPSFIDLYAQNNPVGNGNPDIEPETIDTYEIAFNYFPNNQLRSVLNFYYYSVEDIIDAVGASIGNVGKQKGYGSEIEVSYQPNHELMLQADYAYRFTEVNNSNHSAPDAPRQLAHAGANWKFAADWYTNVEVYWVADRKRAATDTRDNVPDYTLVHASLGYQMEKNLKLSSGVRNLFDKDSYEPSPAYPLGEMDDFKLPGRYLYAELRYAF